MTGNDHLSMLYPKRWDSEFYVLKLLSEKLQSSAQEYASKMKSAELLDMGCGNMPYKIIFEPYVTKYIGVDIADNKQADIQILPNGKVPLPDNCVDIVLSTQVLEHVLSTSNYLSECYRLLRPNGIMILSTHGYWPYHPCPTDFWRWTSAGLRETIQEAGFQIIEFKGIMALASAGIQLFQSAIAEKIPKFKLIRRCFYFLMQSLIQILDNVFPMNRDDDASVFFVVANKDKNS